VYHHEVREIGILNYL